MAELAVIAAGRRESALRAVGAAIGVGIAACVAVAAVQAHGDHTSALTPVLGVGAIIAGATVARAHGRASISGAFVVSVLAASFLGPASAAAAAAISELVASRRLRTPVFAMSFNLLAALVSALAAANVIRALAPAHSQAALYCAVVFGGAVGYLALSYVIVAPLQRFYRGDRAWSRDELLEYVPSLALNVGLTVAGAAIYLKIGISGITFALVGVFAFAYMAHLLAQARHRTQQYVSLSWGVLGGLVRALDIRDGRAARHAAAVARFARDIAADAGMSSEECELAHTAGLLHDIGHFALSDRVAERGRALTDEDWEAIHRHPELGADLLRDLGMYGPVAEIVLAHHERPDGRGYPRGLPAEAIPEIAKIIAVAEVYDTLTASDTYRTPVSSFEALRELRRVAGSQLDARYVEALARLLSGEGVEYRHANAADFDTELAMERRIHQAGAG